MKIVIVGAGLVGLTVAIRLLYTPKFLKKGDQNMNVDNKDYDITIFEKRKKYTREQFLIFGGTKGNLLRNYPNELSRKIQKNVQCYLENPVFDMQGLCFEDVITNDSYEISQSIQISTLEKILFQYIKDNYNKQIKIVYKQFTSKDVNDYDIVIGADGQKSYVREKIMKVKWEDMKQYETYVLHMKYTDLSNKEFRISKNLLPKKVKESYSLSLKRAHLDYDQHDEIFEQDRFRLIRSNTNKTQFLLQVRKSIYNKIKNMKRFDQLPTKIKNSVLIDSYLLGSKPRNLDKTEINIYNTKIGHSNKYCLMKNKKLFFLIGDSAMTTHVFTGEGLNIDFNRLIKTVEACYDGERKIIDKMIHRYNWTMKTKFEYQIRYSAMLRYMPHKLLDKICSKVKLIDVTKLSDHLGLSMYKDYEELVEEIQKRYKKISDKEIKNELCYIFRDKILKHYTYKL